MIRSRWGLAAIAALGVSNVQAHAQTSVPPEPVPEPIYYPPLPPAPPTSPPPPAPPPTPRLRWKREVLVCVYLNPTLAPEVADEMREILPRAADVWNRHANSRIRVQFVADKADCKNVQWVRVEGVPIFVNADMMGDDMGFAAADALGNELGGGDGLHFATAYRWNEPVCGDNGIAGPSRCRFGDAVHEFGHLLGFSHDHLSINAPNCINLGLSLEQRNAGMTYYDPHSVMNYCNPDRWKGELSPADICSLRVAYPFTDQDIVDEKQCYHLAEQAAHKVSTSEIRVAN